ncbi:putative secreted protein [Corynebacterium deserti GIMN1.010]|uniref:Putative secreted protein n=1 Tax=Corynebacterium deserti GIMN1.010 TaxID=931089 RepID=A0A0M4CDX7_9CORY|nr:hypothetical protein [Corynebacterium deserti]ALC04652.1 putative secreted protein [Corynebacterium deserti GIMN1.010]
MFRSIIGTLTALTLLTTGASAVASPAPQPNPGLYSLHMGEGQTLTCMFTAADSATESDEDVVARCAANFPTTWKLIDGAHEQAAHLIITQDDEGTLDITASKEPLITIAIAPMEVTDSAVINGIHITLTDNEALFATSADDNHPVLITPDSYEVLDISADIAGAKVGATSMT